MNDWMPHRGQSREKAFGPRVSAPCRGAFRPATGETPRTMPKGATAPVGATLTRNHHARR